MKLVIVLCLACLYVTDARPGKSSKSENSQEGEIQSNGLESQLVEKQHPTVAEVKEELSGRPLSRRKNVVHKKPYNDADLSMELFRETLSHHVGNEHSESDPCRYMRCRPGEECKVKDDRAQCVCKRHCKERHNPLCGTDDEYYDNHCEMHRQACMSGRDIYDARHKDCFYKANECSGWEIKQYQDMMLQFYRNVINSAEFRYSRKKDRHIEEEGLIRRKRGEIARSKRSTKKGRHEGHKKHHRGGLEILPEESEILSERQKLPAASQDEFDIAATTVPTSTTRIESPSPNTVSNQINSPLDPSSKDMVREDSLEMLKVMQSHINLNTDQEEIMTKDPAGDMVKYLFALMDLDSNGKVGSDEIWEITSLQHLDNVLPGPCTLFHVWKYGDKNDDRTLDIAETLQLFNISVFRLRKEERYVNRPAVYGSPAKLQCGIDGEAEPLWHRYGREVQEKNGARAKGQFLYLNDVTSKNAGNYTCSARTRKSMTQTIDLQIMIAPKVEVHPRTQHPTLRSSTTVKCHAEGRPRPAIRWERNGEPLNMKSGRYILMANNTELHFNAVEEEDSAAYSCLAENQAGIGEDIGAVYVRADGSLEKEKQPHPSYFVFHQYGISVVNPNLCQAVRTIRNSDKIPGLLLQDKLCATADNDVRECVWADSVVVGFRFIYAAQPTEDRIIVVDKQLERVVEVISTDLIPVQLYYVESTDQVFVLCWVDESRSSSFLQVIHSAAVAGSHFAEHIRPVANSGHRVYDRSVYDMFIPPESTLNPTSQHGFVIHRDEPMIHKLNLASLTYVDPIDLSPYGCFPLRLNYLPIGGLLHVTCVNVEDNEEIHEIAIDVETDAVVYIKKNAGVMQEYFSDNYDYAIKLLPQHDTITLYNISSSGKMHEFMIIRTNFEVGDVYFSRKKYNPDVMVAYLVAKNQGNIMYVDLEKKKVEIVDGMTAPATDQTWPWKDRSRRLTPSGWFGWFLATAGRTGLEILGLNSNQILCRMDQFVHATAVSWSGGGV